MILRSKTDHCIGEPRQRPALRLADHRAAVVTSLLQPVVCALACLSLLFAPDILPNTPSSSTADEEKAMRTLLADVFLRVHSDVIELGNSRLHLSFDKASGRWTALRDTEASESVISPPPELPLLDARVDDEWILRQYGSKLLGYETSVGAKCDSASLSIRLGVASPKGSYELTATYTLEPEDEVLRWHARLARTDEAGPDHKLQGFLFRLPGVCLGSTDECVVDVPGPWFPNTFVAPETPYSELKSRTVHFHGAPDGGFGLLAVTNRRQDRVLAAWMDTGGEANYGPSLHGDGSCITFALANNRLYRLPPRTAVESDACEVYLGPGGLPSALARYRRTVERTMPLDVGTPDWVRDAVILEVYPQYFRGGLRELKDRLPFYRSTGFNTIYLMPHWRGGYSPIDPYQVEPSLGMAEDLKEMVSTAHALGMRVLFDMVIHGFNEKSPVVQDHPELFIHNEDGSLARHPTWRSISTDWASPAYQQYMVGLVLHDLREYNIDGYRVDAASYKGANWHPGIPYPAYRSGSAAPELMRRMISAMRRVKPDCVLLSEVFGPVFYTASNLVHDNQTEAPQQLLEMMDQGRATAETYKKHIANVLDMLPQGANRVFFARNHDTSWFYHFNGYTPRFLALDAIHALCAIPEVFAGDPKHGPNPDDDPSTYSYYRKLFALKRRMPELRRGELLLRQVVSDNPWVFAAVRRYKGRTCLIAVSLSGDSQHAVLRGTNGLELRPCRLRDPMSGAYVDAKLSADAPGAIAIQLAPYQVLVGRM